MNIHDTFITAAGAYQARTGHAPGHLRAVLFDMDGVLYDSMPNHAKAWKMMCDEAGIDADEDEFFAYEGRTGASTINLLYRRQYGYGADEETCRRLYAIKSRNFRAMGEPVIMEGAQDAVGRVTGAGLEAVLVTGSGQASILERIARDYPCAFSLRVTAHDVVHGKPHPEPFLKGLDKAGVRAWEALAVDNAPLGVESASAAGIFTIGVRTGPLEPGSLLQAGADIESGSMTELSQLFNRLFGD